MDNSNILESDSSGTKLGVSYNESKAPKVAETDGTAVETNENVNSFGGPAEPVDEKEKQEELPQPQEEPPHSQEELPQAEEEQPQPQEQLQEQQQYEQPKEELQNEKPQEELQKEQPQEELQKKQPQEEIQVSQPQEGDQQQSKLDDLPNKEAALQDRRIEDEPMKFHVGDQLTLKIEGEENDATEVRENKNTNNDDNNNSSSNGNDRDDSATKHEEEKNILEQVAKEDGPKPSSTKPNPSVQTEGNNLAVPQSHEIVIPNYAKWFNLTKIHLIEKQSLPEFFTNRIPSKTPQVYAKYRNFMVNSYRLNPNEYFSVTTARRNVCGDAAAVFRIHKFLMKWGLINYQVDAKLLPKSVEPPFTGEYSTRHDAPRGLFPFESYKPSVQLPDMAKLKKMMDTEDSGSALHKYLKDERRKSTTAVTSASPDVKAEEEKLARSEPKEDTDENPHGTKRPRILEKSTTADDGWVREDVQKLLASIQTHGSDWYKIAKEVGSKTPEQCILKFLQMPIEDGFLHQNESNSGLGSLKYAPHLPFSKSENPVMSTLAFLVGLVDPKIVQSMTDRALKSMEDVDQQRDPPNTKEASELAISSLGVRSHVFATNEERQMNAVAHQMAQVQLQKVDAKLKLLDKIEKSLELEKKALQRQQEEVLVQRISLAKHANQVHQKLEDSFRCFDDKEKLANYVAEFKELVENPPKLSIGSACIATEKKAESSANPTEKAEGKVRPVSIEAPQSYRYWSA